MSWNPSAGACFGYAPAVLAPPNLADYVTFLRNTVGIPALYLANISNILTDSSAGNVVDSMSQQILTNPTLGPIALSLSIAMELANWQLSVTGDIYTFAVYNLAADRLVNFAPDMSPQTFFADVRKQFNLLAISPGIITSASDEGTSTSFLVPEYVKDLSMLDLQMLRTPWGRVYMGYAQSVGTLWGIS